jgi:sugar phosphate isomerase/epimerase
MKLACQEHILPGDDILEKWEFASYAGFDGIELRGTDDWRGRLDDLKSALEEGVVFSSVCLISDRFIGDLDAGRRREAVEHMKHLLSGIAELGGKGAITPRPSASLLSGSLLSRCPARKKKIDACCSTPWRSWENMQTKMGRSCSSSRSTATRITCSTAWSRRSSSARPLGALLSR